MKFLLRRRWREDLCYLAAVITILSGLLFLFVDVSKSIEAPSN